ncbi:MAG: DNA repair protein RecN [Firmicutes bacterium]|nr:DNA repair protein RecN [Bacillota bacterium]
MFAELYIENLALIEKVGLVLQPGLNVLSGETGAGKSMLLDAVSLLLGSRGDRDYIRRGADVCRVQGVFLPPFSSALSAKLAELGLLDDEGEPEELILSREIALNGRSVSRINLRPVPLSALKEIGRLLINIHGQREHILLLEPESQLHLLDSFGGEPHRQQREQVAAAYHAWQQAENARRQAAKELVDDAERRRFLEFQINELEAANLRAGETDELAAEEQALATVQKRRDHVLAAYQAVYGGNQAALPLLDEAVRELTALSALDESVAPLLGRLQGLYFELEDAALELRSYKEGIVDDPERLEEISARQYELKVLGKKYNATEERLLEILANNREELSRRENREEYLAGLQKQADRLLAEYQRQADEMHRLREQTGRELGERITAELAYLQMPKAHLAVDLLPKNPAADGCDEVAFMISPNAGEEMKPVARIASGGEMSRIMLAIKVILAGLDEVPTLIFDEIDTGLGGRALVSVAEKLVQVAADSQAVCVTHAPVLAAYADNNLQVEKQEVDGRTVTTVRVLPPQDKVAEISRMLAGDNITDTTRRQAEELIAAGAALKSN